jgi:hypothetical protein
MDSRCSSGQPIFRRLGHGRQCIIQNNRTVRTIRLSSRFYSSACPATRPPTYSILTIPEANSFFIGTFGRRPQASPFRVLELLLGTWEGCH